MTTIITLSFLDWMGLYSYVVMKGVSDLIRIYSSVNDYDENATDFHFSFTWPKLIATLLGTTPALCIGFCCQGDLLRR